MTFARGNEARLLSRQQASFGTAEAAADGAFRLMPFYSYNVSPTGELANDEAAYGDSMPGEVVAGLENLTGSMAVPMGLNSIGWHLQQLFGDPVTSGTEDFSHVFNVPRQQVIRLATHGISHNGIDQHFVQDSLAMTGLELSGQKNGQRQRVTFNLAGRQEVGVAATLDATPVQYAPDPVPVGFQAALLMDGAIAGAVTQAALTLNSGIEPDQEALNGLPTAAAMQSGFWELSGTLGARFQDRVIYDLANTGGSFSLGFKWEISATRSLEIVCPDVRLERTGVPVEGRGILSSSFNWRANRPADGAELMTITLKNSTASYANPV